jgi:hypothetical protein
LHSNDYAPNRFDLAEAEIRRSRVELNAEQLKKSGFDAVIDKTFSVAAPDHPQSRLQLKLIEVKSRPAPPGFEQFSLLFQGAAEPLLSQGTYIFAHADLGELPLFIVPVGKSSTGIQYEVCISRSTEHD